MKINGSVQAFSIRQKLSTNKFDATNSLSKITVQNGHCNAFTTINLMILCSISAHCTPKRTQNQTVWFAFKTQIHLDFFLLYFSSMFSQLLWRAHIFKWNLKFYLKFWKLVNNQQKHYNCVWNDICTCCVCLCIMAMHTAANINVYRANRAFGSRYEIQISIDKII